MINYWMVLPWQHTGTVHSVIVRVVCTMECTAGKCWSHCTLPVTDEHDKEQTD